MMNQETGAGHMEFKVSGLLGFRFRLGDLCADGVAGIGCVGHCLTKSAKEVQYGNPEHYKPCRSCRHSSRRSLKPESPKA